MQVPDKLVGAVLGKGGATLRELQDTTGARIRISKRDEFAPGTTNRCASQKHHLCAVSHVLVRL